MELAAAEVDGGELGVGDLDLVGIAALIELGVDLEAAASRGRGDQVDDHLAGDERLAAPVLADEAEQAVLDFVPLAGAGREVADLDLQAGLVGELLQLDLPEFGAVAVTAAAVGGDGQAPRLRVVLARGVQKFDYVAGSVTVQFPSF